MPNKENVSKSKTTQLKQDKVIETKTDVTKSETAYKKVEPEKLLTYKQKIGRTILWSIILNGTVSLFLVPLGIISGAIFSTLTGTAGFFATLASGLGWDINPDMAFSLVYWILWTSVNTGVIIWGYSKLPKAGLDIKFMHLTVVFVVTGLLTGATIAEIQNLADGDSTNNMFTSTQTFVPSIFNLTNTLFVDPSINDATSANYDPTTVSLIKATSYIEMLVFAILGGIIISYSTFQMLKIGSSTGGLDPVGYYVSVKKGVNFGKFNLMYTLYNQIAFIVLNFWILQFVFANQSPDAPTYIWLSDKEGISLFLSLLLEPRVIGSVVYMLSFNIPMFFLFPRSSKREITVIPKDAATFKKQLLNSNFNHVFNEISFIESNKSKPTQAISAIVNQFEVDNATRFFNELDPTVVVISRPVDKVYGSYYNDKIEFVYKLTETKKPVSNPEKPKPNKKINKK